MTEHFLSTMNRLSRRQVVSYLTWCAMAPLGTLPSIVQSASLRRIISIGGALTQIAFMLEAESELVGVDTTSIYPAKAKDVPSVGYARQLSAEGVLSLAPTHLLATEEAGPPAVLKQIEAAGIPITVLSARHQYQGLRERIQGVGRLLERRELAQVLLQNLDVKWLQVQAQVATGLDRPTARLARVLFILAHSPSQVMVAGHLTAAHAMLTYAGVQNVGQGFKGYKPLTPEGLIAAQPDCILLTEQGLQAVGGLQAVLKIPGLSHTPAGRMQAVVAMDALRLLGFGPRMPEAVLELHQLFSQR